jgi:hypothetical protein
MRFWGLLFALLTSRACAEINDATLAQLRLPASLDVKLKRLFPLIEQCNVALAQKNNTWLKISYDDLLRNFFIIAAEVERNLQKDLDPSFMSLLSQLALLICFYENVLQKKPAHSLLCSKLSEIAPTLGDIFKIFMEEYQRKIASKSSASGEAHCDEVSAKILKMSSFERNFEEIARKIQCANSSKYLNTVAEKDPSTQEWKKSYAIASKKNTVKVPKACAKKVLPCDEKDDSETFGKVFAVKQSTEYSAGLATECSAGLKLVSSSQQQTTIRDQIEKPHSSSEKAGISFDISSLSPEDVLLALCWLSVVCRDEKTQHQVERMRSQIGHQLMRKTLEK